MNFNKPYFASSPSDFWQRWHISLSSWLRDYFYIPLGGNRMSNSRTYLNLITVMFFGGLWHGASINFIIWGILHGGYLSIHRIIIKKCPKITKNQFFNTRFGKIISILITQYFIFLA
jgi:alginate O-acetyltransferase complex protein AlgI